MRILTTHAEANLTELARHLFKIEGPHAVAEERKAIAALRHANPHLRAGAKLAEGAPIVVPDIEGLGDIPSPAVAVDLSKEHVKELRTALTRAGEALKSAHDQELNDEKAEATSLRILADDLDNPDEAVARRLAAVEQAGRRRVKELAERRKLHQQALARLGKDLEVLMKALG